jgi:HSP20 family protein
MAIMRWDPFHLRPFSRWPKWFGDWDWESEWPKQRGLRIRETDKDIVVEAVVAGVPAKDVEVNIEDGVLTIKAEAEEKEKKKKEEKYASYRYYYTTALSGGNWPKARAEIEDGVVTVTIPKAEEAKPQKIKITTKKKK